MGQERKLVKQFDKDADGRLNRQERVAARAFLKKDRAGGGGRGRFGPPGFGGGEGQPAPSPGLTSSQPVLPRSRKTTLRADHSADPLSRVRG